MAADMAAITIRASVASHRAVVELGLVMKCLWELRSLSTRFSVQATKNGPAGPSCTACARLSDQHFVRHPVTARQAGIGVAVVLAHLGPDPVGQRHRLIRRMQFDF